MCGIVVKVFWLFIGVGEVLHSAYSPIFSSSSSTDSSALKQWFVVN